MPIVPQLNKKLLQTILDNQKRVPHTLSLADMGITSDIINQIYEWAKPYSSEGELASYIPELARVNPDNSAIVIGDLLGNEIAVGNGVDVKVLNAEVVTARGTYNSLDARITDIDNTIGDINSILASVL